MVKNNENQEKTEKKNNNKKSFTFAVGRRRQAIARVRLYKELKEELKWGDKEVKKGDIFVNQRPIEEYFRSEVAKKAYSEPFRVTNSLNQFTVTIRVIGGGVASQLEAVVHALSRSLADYDKEKFRPILKSKGFLTRDARVRQRRKVGMGGKSRRKKQSPKR